MTQHSKHSKPLQPAEKIAGNDDLLREILLRLPALSLLRFRTVSGHWCHLISAAEFRRSQSRRRISAAADGIFLFRKSDNRYHLDHLLNLSETSSKREPVVPANVHTFIQSFPSIEPMHCCNGLLILKLHLDGNRKVFYCVYNPCTNRYTNIPVPDVDNEEIVSMNLAFDPEKSGDYKIVCVLREGVELYRFLTFCSENNWKESGQQVRIRGFCYFTKGVFLNGALHFVSKCSGFLRFDVDDEVLKPMPSASVPEGLNGRKIKWFGECEGRLCVIEENVVRPTLLNVFELEKDYSKWFLKNMVDVYHLSCLFPLMVINEPESLDVIGYQFDVLFFVDGGKEGKTMLVLSLPEKIVSYDVKSMSVKELLKVQLEEVHLSIEGFLVYNYKWYHAYKHVESLAFV